MMSEENVKHIMAKDETSNAIRVTTNSDSASVAVAQMSKMDTDAAHDDSGLDSYRQALEMDPARRDQVAKTVLRKLDFMLLPLMCAVCMTAYLEKATLNYANAYSLQKDLGLEGRDYAWAAAIANLGVMVGSYPASLAVQKLPVGKLMACLLLIWGMLSMVLAAAKNFGAIFSIRLLLGIAEAGQFPAWVVLTSMFWTNDEQPLRMCFWLGSNGLASMLGAGIATGLGSVTDAAVRPWQLIFLVIGSFAVILGILCFFVLPSSPQSARFLSEEERIVCVWRIAKNQTGIKHSKVLKHQAIEALKDVRVWCILIQQFATGLLNGAITNYYSAFLRGFGWSSMDAVKYQLPIGAIQIVATVIAGYLASRYRNRTIIIILVFAIFPIVAMVGFSTIPADQKLALTACVWIVAPYGGAIVLTWSIMAANFAGHTKRMVINGINFVGYWGGNFAGPFVFNPVEAPRYITATKVLGGMLGLGWVVTAALGVLMWHANRRRDGKAAAGNALYDPTEGSIEGFSDRTDKENKSFRYRY